MGVLAYDNLFPLLDLSSSYGDYHRPVTNLQDPRPGLTCRLSNENTADAYIQGVLPASRAATPLLLALFGISGGIAGSIKISSTSAHDGDRYTYSGVLYNPGVTSVILPQAVFYLTPSGAWQYLQIRIQNGFADGLDLGVGWLSEILSVRFARGWDILDDDVVNAADSEGLDPYASSRGNRPILTATHDNITAAERQALRLMRRRSGRHSPIVAAPYGAAYGNSVYRTDMTVYGLSDYTTMAHRGGSRSTSTTIVKGCI